MAEEKQGPPPQAVLGELINGYWKSMSIAAAARLQLADQFTGGPQPVAALAQKLGLNQDALYRLLRALASLGIFAETEPRTFAQTPLSELLRSDVPGSLRGLADMSGRLHFRAWPELAHSVKTGGTAFKQVFGAEIFQHLPKDPEAAAAFDAAMTGYTQATANAVVAAYDFSPFKTVVDIGGGSGALLAAIVKKAPSVRGIDFDLPHVADRARAHLQKAGVADKIEVQGGDFFQSVPAGDAYAMKMILHDWDDAKSIAILKNVRKSIAAGGKLLVMEAVVPPGNAPSYAKLLDINMLVMTGGRERTEDEFRALFKAAGFTLTRVVPAHPAASVIEGVPA